MLSNEVLWFLFLLINLSVVLLFFRFFGKTGLFIVITYSIVLCNIQVLKQVSLFGFNATLGNILYAGIFLATDMLGEFYDKKEAQKGVIVGFLTTILMAGFMQIALLFTPNESDFIQPALKEIFGLVPSIVAASLLAYLCSQFHDVLVFDYLKKKTKGRHLWLRNNASTLLSQLIDSLVFTSIAVWLGAFGDIPLSIAFEIFLTTYLIKSVVAIMDTPFLYLACFFKGKEPT
jgi:queuosine precursor transporter